MIAAHIELDLPASPSELHRFVLLMEATGCTEVNVHESHRLPFGTTTTSATVLRAHARTEPEPMVPDATTNARATIALRYWCDRNRAGHLEAATA